MKECFFISDVHLKNMGSPHGQLLLTLLEKAIGEAEMFVILGDLFDLWVGEGKAFQTEYNTLIEKFIQLKKKCRIIYFEGNHDLHLKDFWQEQIGIEVYEGPMSFEFHGVRIWAEHGDEINREDHGYLALRRFLRSSSVTSLLRKIPSEIIWSGGRLASHISRRYTTKKVHNKNDHLKTLFRTYAKTLRAKTSFDLLVTGHTHIEDDFTFTCAQEKSRLINLGSWYAGPCYLRVRDRDNIEFVRI